VVLGCSRKGRLPTTDLFSPPWHALDDNRLSRLDVRDHGCIRVDPRFLGLVRLAEAKLKARPRELDEQAVANIMNGEWGAGACESTGWYV
jgi:hypothetical protein